MLSLFNSAIRRSRFLIECQSRLVFGILVLLAVVELNPLNHSTLPCLIIVWREERNSTQAAGARREYRSVKGRREFSGTGAGFASGLFQIVQEGAHFTQSVRFIGQEYVVHSPDPDYARARNTVFKYLRLLFCEEI
jgi:hypothetical protein